MPEEAKEEEKSQQVERGGRGQSALGRSDSGPMANLRAEIADPIFFPMLLQRIAEGETLKEVARARRLPYGPLAQWVLEDRTRAEQYASALRFAAETLAHDTIPIADGKESMVEAILAAVQSEKTLTDDQVRQLEDVLNNVTGDPARDKIRIQARQWLSSRWDRARYGEHAKLDVAVEHRVENPEERLLEAARNIGFVLASNEHVQREREVLALPAPEQPAKQSAAPMRQPSSTGREPPDPGII